MNFLFVTAAEAMGDAAGAGGQQGGGLSILFPLLVIMVIFYFLLIRPQQKAEKKRREMLANIKKGDRVLTAGGLRGTVAKVYEKEKIVVVTIAPNVDVEVALPKIEAVAPPGDPLPVEGLTGKTETKAEKGKESKGPKRPRTS